MAARLVLALSAHLVGAARELDPVVLLVDEGGAASLTTNKQVKRAVEGFGKLGLVSENRMCVPRGFALGENESRTRLGDGRELRDAIDRDEEDVSLAEKTSGGCPDRRGFSVTAVPM